MNFVNNYKRKRAIKEVELFVRKNYRIILVIVVIFALFFVFALFRRHKSVVVVDEYVALQGKTDTNLYEDGISLFNSGKFEEGRKYFEVALDKKPDEKAYLQYLGIVDYNLRDYDKAISELEKVLGNDEKNFFVLNVLGNVYRDKGDRAKAREYYQKSTIANAKFISPYVNLVMILDEDGKKEEAKNVIKRGLKQNPDNFELLQLQKTVK